MLRPYRRRTPRRDRRWAVRLHVIDLTMDGAAVTRQVGLRSKPPASRWAQGVKASGSTAVFASIGASAGPHRRSTRRRAARPSHDDRPGPATKRLPCARRRGRWRDRRVVSARLQRGHSPILLALRTEAVLGHWSFENAEFATELSTVALKPGAKKMHPSACCYTTSPDGQAEWLRAADAPHPPRRCPRSSRPSLDSSRISSPGRA